MSIIGDTTLVTEHRMYTVNRSGRKSITKAAVSARSAEVSTESFTVSRTKPHHIKKHANKHLTIKSEHPVRAIFRQGVRELEPVEPEVEVWKTAKLTVPEVILNKRNKITVEDDIEVTSVKVNILNLRTGETEVVECVRIGKVFIGQFTATYDEEPGKSFDGCFNAKYSDEILFQYLDGRNAQAMPETIDLVVAVEPPPPLPKLFVRSHVRPDTYVGIAVRGAGANFCTVVCERLNFSRTLLLTKAGDVDSALLLVSSIFGIQLGDVLEISTTSTDKNNVTHTVSRSVFVSAASVLDVNITPAFVNTPSLITLSEPHMSGHTVGVIIVRGDTNEFERVDLKRVAPYTGVYEGDWTPSEPGMYSLHYVDVTQVVRMYPIEVFGNVTPDEEPTVHTCDELPTYGHNEVEMEINGLFTLNGRFSGVITLFAVDDEIVRCSSVHSS